MVKLYYLAVIRPQSPRSIVLCSHSDLSDFGFFQRSAVKEFMQFSCLELSDRATPRATVSEQGFACHALERSKLACAAVTDDEFPPGAAHAGLDRVLRAFCARVHGWKKAAVRKVQFPELEAFFHEMSCCDARLDESQIALHRSLNGILRRGERLDDLIDGAKELSPRAKAYFKSARQGNMCCSAVS